MSEKRPKRIGICFNPEPFYWEADDGSDACPMCPIEPGIPEYEHRFYVAEVPAARGQGEAEGERCRKGSRGTLPADAYPTADDVRGILKPAPATPGEDDG